MSGHPVLGGARVLVTGGASGIGEGLCRRFAALGADVLVADIADSSALAAQIGGRSVRLDVADADAWGALAAAEDGFDVVALNAGVTTVPHVVGGAVEQPLAAVGVSDYRRIMGVNVDGVVLGTMALLPGMLARGGGQILVTASLAGLVPIPPEPIYGLTKHAVVGFVRSLGPALAPHGVAISAMCPGFVDTPLVSDVSRELIQAFSLGIMPVETVADLAVRALEERQPGSLWTAIAGREPVRFEPANPFP